MTRKVHIHTLGCQMNALDTGKMLALLARDGWEPTPEMESADLVLINTCSVREKPERKLRSLLGRLRVLKLRRPDLIVGVTGCTAQLDGSTLFKDFPGVDLITGPDGVPRIRELVQAARTHRVLDDRFLEASPYPFVQDSVQLDDNPLTGLVTIQKGCDNWCAYCVVPTTRGPEVSRPAEEIVAEVQDLVDRGVRDVTLIGQNVNTYGRKTPGEPTFDILLRRVHDVEGLWRLRFTTSHPRDLDDATVDCWRDLPKLASHLHLPVQSGSDGVLARMNRGYTRAHYLERVGALRAARPGLSLTTDLIVGFPGETDAEFADSLSLMDAAPFDGSFSFKYSPRPFTVAADLHAKDAVPPDVAQDRLQQLQRHQAALSQAANQRMVGSIVEVLVEGTSRHDPGEVCGRTSSFRMVNFPGDHTMVGRLVPVRITWAFTNSLKGALATTSPASD